MDAADTTEKRPCSQATCGDHDPLPRDSMVSVPLSDRHASSSSSAEGPILTDAVFTPPVEDAGGSEPGRVESPLTIESDSRHGTMSSLSSKLSQCEGEIKMTEVDDDHLVDWAGLEQTEEQESQARKDVSTTLLLARLEQENNALATDPKSAVTKNASAHTISRPPSIQQLKDLVNDSKLSLRYSQLPAPKMTELEFWAALVADYPRTAQKLPTLTSHKIRGGVPPPLRGVVWPSIAGARDPQLHEQFGKLCSETSPYEGLIGKDVGRSFPNVEMFRDSQGEGQKMLGQVLKCFSLYDSKIGYCQGLGFVVGPLLMHMTEAEAFCVLVRLMEHYDLRSCFLPTLAGLHLRIFQFQSILSSHLPELHAHLDELKIEPVYISQWFLSFFGVTCPLPLLLRIYDVLLLEGACETLMRVALSLMQRNQKKILACHEFEDVMQLLLSRSLWDPYACNADDLVADFVSLTSLVTRESLQALESKYQESQGNAQNVSIPQLQAIASRFLGRLWAGSNSHNSVKSVAQGHGSSTIASMVVRRTPSKQSMASTLNSLESTSDASTAPTETSVGSTTTSDTPKPKSKLQNDKDLHTQIEDLLMALTDMQREQAALAKELQREREEREEDQSVARMMLLHISEQPEEQQDSELLSKARNRFSSTQPRQESLAQTKQQLRDDAEMWKGKYEIELARCQNLSRIIDDHDLQHSQLKDQLKDARSRVQDAHREKQRLERTIQDLRIRKPPARGNTERPASVVEDDKASTGLREFKLGRATSPRTATFSKRMSSVGAPTTVAGDDECLLLELVNAKTSEAVARQELEEMKAKLETLKRLVSRSATSPVSPGASPALDLSPGGAFTGSRTSTNPASPLKTPNSASSSGGFFSGWTRRATSTIDTPDS
ncbi:hypothetical protein FQN57_006342 [Myotisia sp. PD_48]|nr:hypothetical protein FQN57_006342 [Myotisia sp. PD_48]